MTNGPDVCTMVGKLALACAYSYLRKELSRRVNLTWGSLPSKPPLSKLPATQKQTSIRRELNARAGEAQLEPRKCLGLFFTGCHYVARVLGELRRNIQST